MSLHIFQMFIDGSPTVDDVKSSNKLTRQIKSHKLQYWTIEDTWISSSRNNDDDSVFLTESRERVSV